MKNTFRLGSVLLCTSVLLFAASCKKRAPSRENPPVNATSAYRINAGGDQLNTSLGAFAADQRFSPSPGQKLTKTAAIANTTDDALYQSERYGTSFGYALPVSNGTYTVRLHFADNWVTATGQRRFDVSLEKKTVLDNYDIFAKAKVISKALVESFQVTVSDGTLNIDFSSLAAVGGLNNATVAAIEVLAATTTTPPPADSGNPPADNTTPPTTVNLLYQNNFESSSSFPTVPNTAANGLYNQSPRTGAISLTTQLKRENGSALRFELTKADAAKYNLSDPNRYIYERAELTLDNEKENERWYGISMHLPTDYAYDPNGDLLLQWKVENSSPNPPIQLLTWHDRLYLKIKHSAVRMPRSASQITEVQYDLGPVTKGAWVDWVFHIRFSHGTDGILEVWKNGVKVVSRLNQPNTYNDPVYPGFRFGVYKWDWETASGRNASPQDKRVLYYDAVRVGNKNATYQQVAPR